MALVNPDTSEAPRWRFPVKRKESPIKAWRVWDLRNRWDGWLLKSVANEFLWEGPFARADKRPLDPKHWDELKKPGTPIDYTQRDITINYVIHTAGIHAVKTNEQAVRLVCDYSAPVYGEIDLWGRVAQFQLGYRAEFAMIKHLWLDTSWITLDERKILQIAADLMKRYDCEVEIV